MIELVSKCISALWKFCTNIITIAIVSAIVLFVLTIFMPDNVVMAIDIVKNVIENFL